MSHNPKSPLMGNMMSQPLLISSIIQHADRYFGSNEIVSRGTDGGLHRYTYRDCHKRARKMANALVADGVRLGDRVATLAWNGYRHMELYYAISGSGAVLHTINPRLHADQIAYIVNHADDQYLFFDAAFLPLIETVATDCRSVKAFIMMCDREHLPAQSSIAGLLCYEDLIEAGTDDFEWPVFDENAASSLCYTSGTTGNPKGALYSHRSTVLHSLSSALPDAMNISARDTVLPVVPMFHVNAWGLPYSVPLTGAKMVFAGAALDGKSLYELLEQEGVNLAAGVPTVWLGLLNHVRQAGLRFSTLKSTLIGGAACPPSMMRAFRDEFGVDVVHAWGMTEMSPLGTVGTLQRQHLSLPEAERQDILSKQGRPVYGVDMKIVDHAHRALPWDGKTSGDLLVKGPWVIDRYFQDDRVVLQDGWFPTGDIATISADGYMQITDRSKDVIKSGGEWISSIDLENIAMSHPSVRQAACIGIVHPKWDERPLLIVERQPDASLEKEELMAFYAGKIATWWTPDDVVFVEAMPTGATGKILKNRLREQFKDFRLSAA